MPRLLGSLIVIGIVTTSVIGLTRSFFSDTERSANNALTAGTLDLKIDNTSFYNGVANVDTTWLEDNLPGHFFFKFNDIKPGDRGEDTISLHVQNNAWGCMDINLTANDDNTCTEPELIDDPLCASPGAGLGELAQNINFAFWGDDGDNVYETNETIFKSGSAQALFNGQSWTLADSASSVWPTPGPIPADEIRYVGKFWCLGNLTQTPVAPGANDPTQVSGFGCDGTALNNATQTDSALADVNFTAVQARNNPNFLCNPTPTPTITATPTPTILVTTTPTITPTPTTIACSIKFADTVVSSAQGKRKDGTAVLASRSNPLTGLVAQSAGNPFDSPVVEGTFFSLGFPFGQTLAGTITVRFNGPFTNIPGDDLKIFEVTGGPAYPEEKVQVEVSPDNITYTNLGIFTKDASMDMVIPSAQYVRLTEASTVALFEDIADGYDLDGVQALCRHQ